MTKWTRFIQESQVRGFNIRGPRLCPASQQRPISHIREYSEDQQQIILKPVPQVGFRKLVDSEIEYYLLDRIPAKRYFDENGFDLDQPGSIRILPSTEVESIRMVLLEKGFTFKAYKDVNPDVSEPSLLCKIEVVIDDVIIRALAKIAFNYLAYWQGPKFMLEANFNPTREFIRYGVKPQYPLIKKRKEERGSDF